MKPPIYKTPRHVFTFDWPIAPRVKWTRWFRLSKFSVGYFGCSSATNTTRTLIVLGRPLLTWKRLEFEDSTDKERADRYLNEWSKCEKELQMFRLARLGEDAAPHVKQVIKDSLGVDLDEGTIRGG